MKWVMLENSGCVPPKSHRLPALTRDGVLCDLAHGHVGSEAPRSSDQETFDLRKQYVDDAVVVGSVGTTILV
jgi:hypothetical protein